MAEQTPKPGGAKGGAADIAEQNDWLRANIHAPGTNRIVMTAGVADLIGDTSLFRGFRKRAELMRTVRDYDAFGPDIDPHGERDMGAFEFEGARLYWKIDYYSADLSAGSENPADPFVTTRVLTIMRVEER